LSSFRQTVKATVAEVEAEISDDHAQVDDIEHKRIINGLAYYMRHDAEEVSAKRKDDEQEALVLAGARLEGFDDSGRQG
jgi:hypothetical protein